MKKHYWQRVRLWRSPLLFTAGAAENDKPQYLSDWWHQSVNVVGSYHTRFGPQIRNDTYGI